MGTTDHLAIITAENPWPSRAAAEAQAEANRRIAQGQGWKVHSVAMHTYVIPPWDGGSPEIVHMCTIALIRE